MTRVTGNEATLGVDLSRASSVRVHDYILGGKDNFAADREFGERIVATVPQTRWIVREARAFLERAVKYCAEQGVRQFLDIGSGLPTTDSVHEVARRVDPACRVVYVDIDPMAVAHAQALLATGIPGIAAIRGDARRPAEILDHGEVRALIDPSRPVAVLMGSLLHYLTDVDDPAGVIAGFMGPAAPGSHLVLSHGTFDMLPEESAQVSEFYRGLAVPLVLRSKHEVSALFAGLELVEPGVVFTAEWRPLHEVDDPGRAGVYAGVARKRGDRAGTGQLSAAGCMSSR
ncbi:MAG TPA: SAM-dependent methyltransferase [Streptosporangiaceae bacterium]